VDGDGPLAALVWHWGDAYVIGHPEPGVWTAVRRDTRGTLRAGGPEALRDAIIADYTAVPVPRLPVLHGKIARRNGG